MREQRVEFKVRERSVCVKQPISNLGADQMVNGQDLLPT